MIKMKNHVFLAQLSLKGAQFVILKQQNVQCVSPSTTSSITPMSVGSTIVRPGKELQIIVRSVNQDGYLSMIQGSVLKNVDLSILKIIIMLFVEEDAQALSTL